MNIIFLFAAFVWVMAIPLSALAHGTDYRLIGKEAVVAAEFFYSDKTPMQYAEILVFSPESDKVEYQNGRTDQNGRFAFLAQTPGEWQVRVNDGMGHAVHANVTVNPIKSEPTTADEISGNRLNEATKKKRPCLGRQPWA
jgi:nickel transport protein